MFNICYRDAKLQTLPEELRQIAEPDSEEDIMMDEDESEDELSADNLNQDITLDSDEEEAM